MLKPEATFCALPFATLEPPVSDDAIRGDPHGPPHRPGVPRRHLRVHAGRAANSRAPRDKNPHYCSTPVGCAAESS